MKSSETSVGLTCSVEVDGLSPRQWDDLASDFLDASDDQLASSLDIRWGPKRLSHLLLRREGTPVAGAQVLIFRLPAVKRGLAYIKFGPLWRRRDAAADADVYRAVISALVSEYCHGRGHCLTVLPRPNPQFMNLEVDILREFGFKQRRPISDPKRYLVNVALGPAEQMRSLDQKWRYNLRQAQQHEIRCRMADDLDELATFTSLHTDMQRRKRFEESAAIARLPELARRLPEPLRPRLALAAHEGVPVAGAVITLLGDTAYYAFGASNEAGLHVKAGYALHWWILNWLGDKGVLWYDLGGEVSNPGLRQFKKGLVGKSGAVVTMPGEFDIWTDPVGRVVADGLYGIRAARGAMSTLSGKFSRAQRR